MQLIPVPKAMKKTRLLQYGIFYDALDKNGIITTRYKAPDRNGRPHKHAAITFDELKTVKKWATARALKPGRSLIHVGAAAKRLDISEITFARECKKYGIISIGWLCRPPSSKVVSGKRKGQERRREGFGWRRFITRKQFNKLWEERDLRVPTDKIAVQDAIKAFKESGKGKGVGTFYARLEALNIKPERRYIRKEGRKVLCTYLTTAQAAQILGNGNGRPSLPAAEPPPPSPHSPASPAGRSRGRPAATEKHKQWKAEHDAGKSLGQIAHNYNVTRRAVVKALAKLRLGN